MKKYYSLLLTCLLMLAAYLITQFVMDSKKPKLNKELKSFSKIIGNWESKTEIGFPLKTLEILNVTDYLHRNYYFKEQSLNLYIGFYASQQLGKQIHSPKNCLPGSGWEGNRYQTRWIPIPQLKEKGILVNQYLVSKAEKKSLVIYWFQSRGRKITSEYWDRIYLVWDAITKNRTDGSIIRIILPIKQNEMDLQLKIVDEYIYYLIPELDKFIPS
jgi:EpsI family protein